MKKKRKAGRAHAFLFMAPDKSIIIDAVLIALLICAGLAITLPKAGRAIWYDEACTVDFAKAVPNEIVDVLAAGNNMPAYYFLMSAWTGVFGTSEAALRMPGIIFYIVSALLVYLFGRRLFHGRGPGFISAIFYLLMIINTSQAVDAKPYSMLALLSIASLWLFYEVFIMENSGRLLTAAFIAVNITGTLTHVWFFFAGAAQFIFYLADKKTLNKRLLAVFGVSYLTFFAVWGGVFFKQLLNKSSDWMIFKGDELFTTLGLFTAYNFFRMLLLLGTAVLAGILADKFIRKIKKRDFQADKVFFLGAIILASLLIPFGISFFKPIYDPARGPIIAAAPFALLFAGYLCSISYKPVFYAFFTLIAVYLSVTLYSFDPVDYYNARTLTGIIIDYTEKADKTIIYGEMKREVRYYLDLCNFKDMDKIVYNPDFMDYKRLEQIGKTDEAKKHALHEKFIKQLDDKNGTLVFVFNEGQRGQEEFDAVYSKLNSSREVLERGNFCGTELVLYK